MHWDIVWTRLVLFDVYVRTCLLFGAPVWAPKPLVDMFPGESRDLQGLGVLHRRGLRQFMGAPADVRTAILHVASCRAPLALPLGKAVYRYYARLA